MGGKRILLYYSVQYSKVKEQKIQSNGKFSIQYSTVQYSDVQCRIKRSVEYTPMTHLFSENGNG